MNCLLDVTRLPEALETSSEGFAEAAKKEGFARVIMWDEVNTITFARNCVLEVTQLPKALETSAKGVAEVAKTAGLVGVTMRSELNSIPEC